MRLRNNPNAEKELSLSEVLIKEHKHKIDKNTILEFGMGKGEMITKLAELDKNRKYIGVEKYATVAHLALKRAQKMELNNFKILCCDIKEINDWLEGKVDLIWLTFSDPWPKNRHERRRLTYKSFLDIYKKLLTKEGIIKLKTDNDKFFEYSLESIAEYGMELIKITRDLHNFKEIKDNVMTGYEEKWSNNGKKINYLEARFKNE